MKADLCVKHSRRSQLIDQITPQKSYGEISFYQKWAGSGCNGAAPSGTEPNCSKPHGATRYRRWFCFLMALCGY